MNQPTQNYNRLLIMKLRIKSITESFSMQPNTWTVSEAEGIPMPFSFNYNIAEIKLERIGPDEFYDYLYIAYDFKGNKLFQWQPKAVNVAYFPE